MDEMRLKSGVTVVRLLMAMSCATESPSKRKAWGHLDKAWTRSSAISAPRFQFQIRDFRIPNGFAAAKNAAVAIARLVPFKRQSLAISADLRQDAAG